MIIFLLNGLFINVSKGSSTEKELKPLREPVSSEPPQTSASEPISTLSKEEVVFLIHKWSKYYDYSFYKSYALADVESDFNPNAENPNSSAAGIYQFIKSTWKQECEGHVKDANENIKCGIRLLSQGDTYHWEADPSVPKKLKERFGVVL